MKRFFVLYFLVVVITLNAQDSIVPVSGGLARTTALGGGPNNPYISDYSDVFINPAYALKYTHLLFSDIGYSFAAYSASGQYVGITLGFDTIAIGIAVGRREGPMFAENAIDPTTLPFAFSDYMTGSARSYLASVGEPNTPVHIFGAYRIKSLIVGAAFYRSGWSKTDDGTGSLFIGEKMESSQGQTGVKVGILTELNPNVSLDGAILFRNNSSTIEFTDSDTSAAVTASKYDANGNEIGINARAFIKLNEKMDVVPQARFGYFGYEPQVTTTPAPAPPVLDKPNKYSKIEYEIGAAINSKFTGGWATIGLSIQSIKLTNDITTQPGGAGTQLQTTKNSSTWFDLPKINVGSEFELLSWLTGRVGYFKRLSTRKTVTEPPAAGSKTTEISGTESGYIPNLGMTALSQQLSLGIGLKLGRLAMDGYIGERFIASGSYLLSGRLQDLFGVLSMSVKL